MQIVLTSNDGFQFNMGKKMFRIFHGHMTSEANCQFFPMNSKKTKNIYILEAGSSFSLHTVDLYE